MDKLKLLEEWAVNLARAAGEGQFTKVSCPIKKVYLIDGPRAGVLLLHPAGLGAGILISALKRYNCAALRPFVPWTVDRPLIYMTDRFIRCECAWPREWARTMIRLTDLDERKPGKGQFIIGEAETGPVVIGGLSDRTPHFLLAGTSGSGKSKALQLILFQLCQDPDNELILVDGKQGESLRLLQHLPGVLGPVATEGPDIRGALAYAVQVMRQRGESNSWSGRLIVAVDEIQEIIQDSAIADMLRLLAAQGRSRGVHVFITTQHPTTKAFGDPSVPRNLTGRIALQVVDHAASRVVTGSASWPRADFLGGSGDGYAIGPGCFHRVQVAWVDRTDFDKASNGYSWRFQRWPEFEAEDIGQDLPANGGRKPFTGDQLGASMLAASLNPREGRDALLTRLREAELGPIGTDRVGRLRDMGRDAITWLNTNGWCVCRVADSDPDPTNVHVPVPPKPTRLTEDVW